VDIALRGRRRALGRIVSAPRRIAKLTAWGAFTLLSASLAAGCAVILGLDEEPIDVVAAMCDCDQMYFLDECEDTLRDRLELATEKTRAEWMKSYDEKNCEHCENVLQCYRIKPTCSPPGSPCAFDVACCGFTEGGPPACVDNLCASF
jgi:hypothetical protein